MNPASGRQPLLNVVDLQAWLPTPRGVARAVDTVSFSVDQGRTLGIVGESGCGKSMLAKAILGLLPASAVVPRESAILYKGKNLIHMPQPLKRRIVGREITMIFQEPMTTLNPVMKVGHQVAESVRYHLKYNRQAAWERAITLLDQVGIPMAAQRASQYPHQLSGGLCQRVAIAIALACEPTLLVADEPTTALDVTVQASILELLASLQQDKRMGMILITHDLGVVAGRTHETAVMYAGKIVEHAATSDIFKKTAMPYTQALMAAIPRLADRPHTKLQAIGGQPPDMTELPTGCRFAPRCRRSQTVCRQSEPVLKRMDQSDHRVACWFPLNRRENPSIDRRTVTHR